MAPDVRTYAPEVQRISTPTSVFQRVASMPMVKSMPTTWGEGGLWSKARVYKSAYKSATSWGGLLGGCSWGGGGGGEARRGDV